MSVTHTGSVIMAGLGDTHEMWIVKNGRIMLLKTGSVKLAELCQCGRPELIPFPQNFTQRLTIKCRE